MKATFQLLPGHDLRLAQVLDRDRRADGQFVYAVKTTGIYCRPSCSSRRPLPENVEFHESWEDAEAAGYRACLRCKPREVAADRNRELVRLMCALLDSAERPLRLRDLAATVELSPFHAHRLFRSIVGLTPRKYAAEGRAARLRAGLVSEEKVSQALYEAGYSAPSRLYESVSGTLGMTPSQFRRGAPGLTVRYALGTWSLGTLLVARTDIGLCAVLLGDTEAEVVADLRTRFSHATLEGPLSEFAAELEAVVHQIEAADWPTSLPLDLQGTVFQRRIWSLLREIPPGTTLTYSELAARAGLPSGARAVARACATNPLAVLVPCHRVVRSSGELAGYRWGIERKATLLEREAEASAGTRSTSRAKLEARKSAVSRKTRDTP